MYGKTSLPNDCPAWVLDLIKDNSLGDSCHDATENVNEEDDRAVVKSDANLTILQSKSNTQSFKNILKIKMMTGSRLYKVILDLEARNKWDDSFDKGTIIHYFNSFRHCIIKQVNKYVFYLKISELK